MTRSIYDIQLDLATSCGIRTKIIWDALLPDQSDILKQKIYSLFAKTNENKNVIGELRRTLFENIWRQRIYTNRVLLSAIIYIMVTKEKEEHLAKQSTVFSLHPVFRTRKCINDNDSAGCCMIFIDEESRVYQSWNQYVTNNVLPKGTMIAPKNGIYTFNNVNEVELELHLTPATWPRYKVVNTTNALATVGCIAAPIMLPVVAPVAIAATVTFSAIRSMLHLRDRSKHEQSVGLSNRASRGSWLSLAGGMLAAGSFGANAVMSAGKLALATKIAATTVQVSSVLLTGSDVANNVYNLYLGNCDGHKFDYMQLASSLIIFTHSVNNFAIASKIVASESSSTLKRDDLKESFRKPFSKLDRRTSELHPEKLDVIRPLNDVGILKTIQNSIVKHRGLVSTAFAVAKNMPKFIESNGEFNISKLGKQYGYAFVSHIGSAVNLSEVLNSINEKFTEPAARLIVHMAGNFIDGNVSDIEYRLNTLVSTETVLDKILKHCIENYTDLSCQNLETKKAEIMHSIDQHFNSLNPLGSDNFKTHCKTCNGYFYVCDL